MMLWTLLVSIFVLMVCEGARTAEMIQRRPPCPMHCKCTFSDYTKGVARCTTLEPDKQEFPRDIMQIVVENALSPFNVTPGIFAKMKLNKITTVKIVNSSISSLDVNAFQGLSQLTDVDLSDNHLMLIHPDTFKDNTALRRLSLRGNPLQLTQMLPSVGQYVLRSDHLHELDLSRCHLTQLSTNAFSQLKNLEFLDLSGNKLTHINPEGFTGLDQLEEINLSHNDIVYIHPDTFANIEDLTSLNLKGNPLKTFELPSLQGLKTLDLSNCGFNTINEDTLDGASDISFLNISHNSIELIDNNAFSSLDSLRYLDISYNNLRGPLSTFLFETNLDLETLSLAANPELKTLGGFIGEFGNLYKYDISHCGLINVHSKMFKGMHYLANLNISGNDIEKIDPKTFSSLTHLNILDLSNNRLHYLHPNIFASNSELTKLYLSGNLFHHLPAAVFRPLTKLYLLDASNNRISSLWNSTEVDSMVTNSILIQLSHLNLAGNRLKHLHNSSFFSFMKLKILNIENNPFECTPSFIHAIKWLSDHSVHPNEVTSTLPANHELEESVENNQRWSHIFDPACPHPVTTHAYTIVRTSPNDINYILQKLKEDKDKFENIIPYERTVKPSVLFTPPTTAEVVYDEYRYDFLESSEASFRLSALMIFGICSLFIMFVFLNVVLVMYFRSRRNYTLVGYKTSFSGGPSFPTRFPTKRGQRHPYQKLYEECSVPNPIVRNQKKLSIISVFSNQNQAPIDNV